MSELVSSGKALLLFRAGWAAVHSAEPSSQGATGPVSGPGPGRPRCSTLPTSRPRLSLVPTEAAQFLTGCHPPSSVQNGLPTPVPSVQQAPGHLSRDRETSPLQQRFSQALHPDTSHTCKGCEPREVGTTLQGPALSPKCPAHRRISTEMSETQPK